MFAVYCIYLCAGDLKLVSPFLDHIYVNVPVTLSITTTYSPNQNLTIIPSGAFIFNPAVLTLLPGTRSISFTATAVVDGSYDIRFALVGPDASLYQPLGIFNLVVEKCTCMQSYCYDYYLLFIGHFELPNFEEAFQYDLWNTPLLIRPFIVPPTGVTLTLTSDYLDFTPSTLSFTNAAPYAEVSLQLKGLGYSRTNQFTVSFWVGGVDAGLFNTPEDISFTWEVTGTRKFFFLSPLFFYFSPN